MTHGIENVASKETSVGAFLLVCVFFSIAPLASSAIAILCLLQCCQLHEGAHDYTVSLDSNHHKRRAGNEFFDSPTAAG